jgi:hypothetical protein
MRERNSRLPFIRYETKRNEYGILSQKREYSFFVLDTYLEEAGLREENSPNLGKG